MSTTSSELMERNDSPRRDSLGGLAVDWIDGFQSWQIALLRELSFPLTEEQAAWLNDVLQHLQQAINKQNGLLPELILQFAHLHVGGNASLLSANGRTWMPQMGLGVFPDQPPPRLWNKQDFEKLPEENGVMRPLMTTVLHVGAAEPVRREVAQIFLPSGSVTHIYTNNFRAFLLHSKKALETKIQAPAFQGFRFYLPLLNAASFHAATEEELDVWLSGVEAYVTQSHDDHGLLIAFRGDLVELLNQVEHDMKTETGLPERP